MKSESPPTSRITILLSLCALIGVLLGALEWLFFFTKPSFLTSFASEQRILALLGTVGFLAFIATFAGLLLAIIARIIFRNRPRLELYLACIAPAVLLTATSLILADNFSNTLLSFGSEDSFGFARLIYLICVLGCLVFFTEKCAHWVEKPYFPGPRFLVIATTILCVSLLVTSFAAGKYAHETKLSNTFKRDSPALNVLIIGSDGINAHNLSLYGYQRKTSPFLETLGDESLWALNAFSNSAHTGGSIISFLTGKLPFESGVIYPPDVLQGKNSYESLPALLRLQYSYRTIQVSFPKYADALDQNLKNAFDVVNGRSGIESESITFISKYFGEATSLQLKATYDRLSSRLRHVFYIQDSHDAFAEVTGEASSPPLISDPQRLRDLFDFIDESSEPFFAHVHLMGTHGPRFRLKTREYSRGQDQNENFMPDFYDDAVAQFDGYLEKVYQEIERRGLLETTLIVVYSDHGMRFATGVQVPLLFRIPGHAPGTIRNNVQNLDIPKTILDILGVPTPPWVGGRSLLNDALDPCEFILSAAVVDKESNGARISFAGLPSLGKLRVLTGESYYQWNLMNDAVSHRQVDYETQPPECPRLSDEEVRSFFLHRLAEAGHKSAIR